MAEKNQWIPKQMPTHNLGHQASFYFKSLESTSPGDNGAKACHKDVAEATTASIWTSSALRRWRLDARHNLLPRITPPCCGQVCSQGRQTETCLDIVSWQIGPGSSTLLSHTRVIAHDLHRLTCRQLPTIWN